MKVSKFSEKLNKLEKNYYVIEEEIIVVDGVFEGELAHDNINVKSINVYTGSKLTGEKIDNYILSTPSKTPWRKSIKIFANVEKVYISYETPGDTVEAGDINELQSCIIKTQEEVNRYEEVNDIFNDNTKKSINELKNKDVLLENNKADKTYVNVEFNDRYTKDEVFTKEEVLQKIKDVIGSAPEALDTLKEIADSLNNDANFASTMTNQLSNKVDKVVGKKLSDENYTLVEKNKLACIENNANMYVHPDSHNADMIVENENKRFISDLERVKNKEAFDKRHDHSNKGILDKITQALIDSWNSAVSHISDTIKHVTSVERELWNTVINKAESDHNHDERYFTESEVNTKLSTKVDKVIGKELSTNDYSTAEKIKLSGIANGANAYTHPNTHPATIISEDTTHRFATDIEKATWNGKANVSDFPKKVSEFENDRGYITINDIDPSQNHSHLNKVVLDSITQAKVTEWDGKANGVHNHDNLYVKKGSLTWNSLKGV